MSYKYFSLLWWSCCRWAWKDKLEELSLASCTPIRAKHTLWPNKTIPPQENQQIVWVRFTKASPTQLVYKIKNWYEYDKILNIANIFNFPEAQLNQADKKKRKKKQIKLISIVWLSSS